MFSYVIAVNSSPEGSEPSSWWTVKSRHKTEETAEEGLIKISRIKREANIHRIFEMRGMLTGQQFKKSWLEADN